MTMFRPRGDDTPKGLGVTLEHVRKGAMKCLVGLVVCVIEATVVGRGKWVVWPLGMGGVFPVLAISETLGFKAGLEILVCLFGFLGV